MFGANSWVSRQLARAKTVPQLDQSAGQRARVDSSNWATNNPIRFGLLTALSIGGVAALAVWLTKDLSLGWQIAAGIAGAAVGFLLPVTVIFVVEWLAAFPRQRNEARQAAKGRLDTRKLVYADALGVKADVDRRADFARRWTSDELDFEQWKSANAPMQNWEASKSEFADVLSQDDWRALAKWIAEFDAYWDYLLNITQRNPRYVDQQEVQMRDLRDACNTVIAKAPEVEGLLQPLLV
ncbi:hypothetical protein AYO39_02825 [Actinobacteria bacterium SCGC AG-212-D09]|nr:hypothetical protein AYO39_02825 [Actinobacteria bacterium SCGC AG-212-D09]